MEWEEWRKDGRSEEEWSNREQVPEEEAAAAAEQAFLRVLGRFEHRATASEGGTLYEVPRGVEFWSEMLGSSDFRIRAAGRAVLSRAWREEGKSKEAGELRRIFSLLVDTEHSTRLLDAGRLTRGELSALSRVASRHGRGLVIEGPYALIGSGASAHVTRRVLRSGLDLPDESLRRKFARVSGFLASAGVPIMQKYARNVVAFYMPESDYLSYSLPWRVGVNTFSHEATHARFARLKARLARWVESKGYAVPYELDGPKGAYRDKFGDFMTLLNELNSWRVGEGMEGKAEDGAILGKLRQAYGIHIGARAARLFFKTWTAERVRGLSVPRLILQGVRELNALSWLAVMELGRAAVARDDPLKAHNFIRLLSARHPAGQGLPEEALSVLRALEGFKGHDVALAASRYLGGSAGLKALEEETARRDAARSGLLAKVKGGGLTERDLYRLLVHAAGPDPGRRREALYVLERLAEGRGFPVLREWELLRHERRVARKYGWERPRNRLRKDFDTGLRESVERMLLRVLFDGGAPHSKLDLMAFLRERTYPSEFPAVWRKLIEAATLPEEGEGVRRARYLLRGILLHDGDDPLAHGAWAHALVAALRHGPRVHPSVLEIVAEHYRLRGMPWRRQGAAKRLDALWGEWHRRHIEGFGTRSRVALRAESEHLWRMLRHDNAGVRAAALYTLSDSPEHCLGAEERLLETLRGPPSALRQEAVELLSMMEPGFMPKAEKIFKGGFEPTERERWVLEGTFWLKRLAGEVRRV